MTNLTGLKIKENEYMDTNSEQAIIDVIKNLTEEVKKLNTTLEKIE